MEAEVSASILALCFQNIINYDCSTLANWKYLSAMLDGLKEAVA